MNKETRFIFVTGGVLSSLGKGILASSLGALLQARHCSVRLRKLEQYLNMDAGTMSPIQHGEVYVTDDGMEADLDLGHYERFTGVATSRADYITTGMVYANVLSKERKGDYLGACVQVIPHITDAIKVFVQDATEHVDFTVCEIGGTVGDIEGLAYLEAVRQLRQALGKERTLFIHLTLLPYIAASGELKTKPTQHSVKQLQSLGIQPDILVCRSEKPIPQEAREKIALFCNVPERNVIPALDVQNIYEIPLNFQEHGLDDRVCDFFHIHDKPIDQSALGMWRAITRDFKGSARCKIAIVGKYFKLQDAYKSLIEALRHACCSVGVVPDFRFLDAEYFQSRDLHDVEALIVPGGYGDRGIEGKIASIQYARENKIPFLGICLGMQMAVVEFARHVLGIRDAHSTEFGATPEPVVAMLEEWMTTDGLQKREENLGGTMRLGAYPCVIAEPSLAHAVYGEGLIHERHRHRYEVNYTRYKDRLEKAGLRFSGMSPDGYLTEIIEYPDHPWFMGVQFHPEFKSRPFAPHPLFVSLIQKTQQKSQIINQHVATAHS